MLAPIASIELREADMGRQRLRVHVSQPQFLHLIRFRHVPEQGYYVVEPGSPAIELDRCYFNHQVLRRGRMYIHSGAGVSVEFMIGGIRVLRSVRRALVRTPDGNASYFRRGALAWMEQTGARRKASGLEVVAGAA